MSAPAVCTIVTRGYLSYARILAASYVHHHPEARVYTLVVDGRPPEAASGPGIVVEPASLGLASFRELAFKYGPTELSTALKPAFLAFVLEREEAVVYLDPDVLVLRAFDELQRVQRSSSIVLTPHTLAPYPDDGLRPSEQGMLVTGVYNLGFLALRRSPDAGALLEWWGSRLEDGCSVDLPNGTFTDQKWADLVPAYFDSTAVFRDPAYNVAYWNLHERPLERRGEVFFVGGRPIAFFHFSGYDPDDPTALSRRVKRELARTRVEPGSALAELLRSYSELHVRHGWEGCSHWEYGFSRFSDGTRVSLPLRRLYLDLGPADRVRFGDPFRADGADSFLGWATERSADELSPLLERVYRMRADVASAFPDVHGRDRAAFVDWARERGAVELGYEPELVR